MTALLLGLRFHEPYRHTLALGCLKAYADARASLRGKTRTVLLEESVGADPAAVASAVRSEGARVLAISCYAWNTDKALAIARELRRSVPGLLIALGGPDVSPRAAGLLRANPAVDLIARGEGEATFAELLEDLAAGGRGRGIPGTVYRRGGAVVEAPPRPPISDLASLPSPYLTGIHRVRDGDYLVLETSRGCPLRCRFCDWQNGQPRRWFPPERALEEVREAARQACGVYYFVSDADLFADPARARALLDGFRSGPAARGFHWHFQTHLGRIDEALSRALDSACFSIGAGVETVRPAPLRAMRRSFDPREAEASVSRIQRLAPRMQLHIQLIHGLPEDDLAGFRASLDWALTQRPERLFLFRALALPGSEFGRSAAEFGITASPIPPYPVHATRTFSREEVAAADLLAMRAFNLHRLGPVRTVLAHLAPKESPAEGTPLLDLYEDFWRTAAAEGSFFSRQELRHSEAGELARIMDPGSQRLEQEPMAERLRLLGSLAAFARRRTSGRGNCSAWPALRRLLCSLEARLLWEQAAAGAGFASRLQGLLGVRSPDLRRVLWLGLESAAAERKLHGPAAAAHWISPFDYPEFETCLAPRTRHIRLEEASSESSLLAHLGSLDMEGIGAVVLSNILPWVPRDLRTPLFAAMKERLPAGGRLALWWDSAGTSPLELKQGTLRDPLAPPPAAGEVRAQLRAAGWKPRSGAAPLAGRGPLCGRVSWTFLAAV